MKKLLILSLVLILALAACGQGGGQEGFYHLGENLFVGDLGGAQGIIVIRIEEVPDPIPGHSYNLDLDQVAESYPPQAWVQEAEDLGPAGGYVIDTDLAQELIEFSGQGVLVDVRSPEEYEENGLEGAINIPLDEIDRAGDTLDREDLVIVYCRSGNRSAQAAKALLEDGFTNVLDAGGIK